ncbi:MAG: UvrD-helicase domain-containing protein [Flaviflexus sp.]|nr:UvrD-helicase domain-containing protein [Flaviflexus sp.]
MSFLVISASAGTGKTHTLTEEIANRIRSGQLRADQIIATTFTVKAAGELRSRIREALLDAGLVEESLRLPGSLIGTVNSVAGQIVTDYAIDAGLSPQLSILDENEAHSVFRLALDRVLSSAESENRDLLRRTGYLGQAGEQTSRWRTVNDWKNDVAVIAQAARANRISAAQLRDFAERSWEEFSDILGEPGEDRRDAWRSRYAEDLSYFEEAVDYSRGFWSKLEEASPAQVKKAKESAESWIINKNSMNRATGDLANLTAWHEVLASDERATWGDWLHLPALAAKSAPGMRGRSDGKGPGKPALVAFAGTRRAAAEELLGTPQLHEDLRDLITLVMTTAAEALEHYAEVKRSSGFMDFTDQEVLALQLLDQPRVRESIRSRYTFLAVDEFQDTSPIQLALFTKLRSLLTDVIWVGDPKQSIYGFRGTDPELMNAIVRQLREGKIDGELRLLAESWRSTRPVIELSNKIFTRMFTDMPAESIELDIPAQREAAEDTNAGAVEIWDLPGTKADRADMVAHGVRKLMTVRGFTPSDVAVLCRTTDETVAIAAALAKLDIPATTSTSPVVDSPEGRMVVSALAYLAEPASDLPLIELIDLLPEHRAHETWFDDLAAIADSQDWEARSGLFLSWAHDPSLTAFTGLEKTAHGLSPVQLIDAIIGSLRLTERTSEWQGSRQRLENLDALRQAAAEYADGAAARRTPVTLTGLLAYLRSWDGTSTRDERAQAVFVETIHKAKGLGFPAVILVQDKFRVRSARSGCFVYSEGEIDVADPLAGRQLRWWPDLLPDRAYDWAEGQQLVGALDRSEHAKRKQRRELDDEARLLYVALTRSKCFTAIATPGPEDNTFAAFKPARLGWNLHDPGDEITEGLPPDVDYADVIRLSDKRWSPEDVPAELTIGGKPSGLILTYRRIGRMSNYEEVDPPTAMVEPRPWNTEGVALNRPSYSRNRFVASSRPSNAALADLAIIERLGHPLEDLDGLVDNRVGQAIHACLAVPYGDYHPEDRHVLNERLVRQWIGSPDLGRYLSTQVLHLAASRFYEWAERIGATVQTEVPLTARNERGQVMEGWIDALLTTADGELIVVDHKSYAGTDPIGHIAEHYLGQLAAYRSGVKAATGKVPRTLIHLPLRAEIVEVTFPGNAR